MPITIKLNGQERTFDGLKSVSELLRLLDIPSQGAIVEINRRIVRKDLIQKVHVEDGDEIEIIRIVGGG